MVEQRPCKPQVAGSMPALERKDASAVESESGLIPECFGTIRASVVSQGWRRSVGFARWSNAPLLLARQTEDECREDQLQTGIATSIKGSHAGLRNCGLGRIAWKRREAASGGTRQIR